MMKTTEILKSSVNAGFLILINREYPITEQQTDVLTCADDNFPDILLNRTAANALRLAFEKISASGHIVPVSGYRSLAEQTEIYNNSLSENGEAFTHKYVALPDHSEHQSGLAVDLALNKENIDFICPDFPDDGICKKFRQIAPEYGFILRYTKEKESITGISHEPWHFRYVGYPHSKIIDRQGLSLEEYIDFIKGYTKDNRLVFEAENVAEVFYLPCDGDRVLLATPKDSIVQYSGNNIDGFIVTVWRK